MRERKFIEPFSVEQLTQGASFQFQKDVLGKAEAVKAIMANMGMEMGEWHEAFVVFDEKLKLSQKSLATDDIRKADDDRDTAFRQYRKGVKAFLDFPIEEKAEAAKILWQHLKDYNIQTSWELTRQTGMTANLLQDIRQKYGKQVAALGMEPVLDKLMEANDRVAVLIQERNEEKSGRIVGETREARRESERMYKSFVEVLNAYSLVQGAADYSAFIDHVNAEIRRLKLTLPSSKASKKSSTATGGATTVTPVADEDKPVEERP